MNQISFQVSVDDRELSRSIAQRAVKLAVDLLGSDEGRDTLSFHMDIVAAHANGCPLRLSDLLAADDFNFAHDVFGISQHLNRETGKLGDFFRPRFAAHVEA